MEFVLGELSPLQVNRLAGRGRRFWPELLSALRDGSTSDARLKLAGAALPPAY